ncbi:MAG: LamG-like jellyroll fold domain-containing protein [Bacteroidota bacterium]
MRRIQGLFYIAICILLCVSFTFATTYYSQGNLPANVTTSWNSKIDGTGISPSNFTSADSFRITYPDSMYTTGNWSVTGLVFVNGGFLTYQHNSSAGVLHISGDVYVNSSVTLTVNDGLGGYDLVIGYALNTGKLHNSGTISYGISATSNITNAGTYLHTQNGGTIPTFTWDSFSTCRITGVTTALPGGLTQSFGYIIYDSPSQSVDVTLSNVPSGITTLTINSTGSASFILGANINPSTNVTINGGIFDLSTYTTTGSSNFTLASGAMLRVGGAINFPSTFAVYSLASNSIVEYYYGGTISIAPREYGILRINGLSQSDINNVTVKDSMIVTGGEYNTYGYSLTIGDSAVLKINPGGSISGNGPTYGIGSTLLYATGGTFARSVEWSSTSGAGYPYHVRVSDYTTLDLGANSGSVTTKQIAGDLIVDDGSLLDMASNEMVAPLIVSGDFILEGFLDQSSATGGDIYIGGDWKTGLNGFMVDSGRTVVFNGSTDQTIENPIGAEFNFLVVNKPSGKLIIAPGTDVAIIGSTDTVLQIIGGEGIYLNGNLFSFFNPGGKILVAGGERKLFGSGEIQITNSKSIISSGGGTLLFDDSIIVSIDDSIDFGANLTTINGTLKIRSGASTVVQPPLYGPSSVLLYAVDGTFHRGAEWSATTGAGYPHHVQIGSNTVFNLGNGGTAVSRRISGDLKIDISGELRMNYDTYEMTAPLTVLGSIKNFGGLSLSTMPGGNLFLAGDYIHNGTLTSNNASFNLIGASKQIISSDYSGYIPFDSLVIASTDTVEVPYDPLTGINIATALVINSGVLNINGAAVEMYNGATLANAGGTLVPANHVFNFQGTGSITGNLAFDILKVHGAVDVGPSVSIITELEIDSGGYIYNNPPLYGIGSTLRYNTGGTFGRSIEWSSTSGAGYPYHVEITGSTELALGDNSGTTTARAIGGNLKVFGGSNLNMNAFEVEMVAPLTVYGSVENYGYITLSTLSGNTLNIQGNITLSDAALYPNGNMITFFGTGNSVIDGFYPFDKLKIEKSSGDVILASGNILVNDSLFLNGGQVITGLYAVVVADGGVIARTDGHVNGTMRHNFPIGTGLSRTFAIGDSATYAPVDVTFANVFSAGSMTASTSATGPMVSGSLLDSAKGLNRYWNLDNDAFSFDTFDATFRFTPEDIDGGADPLQFNLWQYYDATWFDVPEEGMTDSTIHATGLDGFGKFTAGQLVSYEIVSSASAGGTITPSGSVFVTHGDGVEYTIEAIPGFYISDVTVDGETVGITKKYLFENVTDTGSIHAEFAAIPSPLISEYSADANTAVLLRFNETSGDIVYDYSGNDNFGTAYGPGIVSGRIGNARGFDGTHKHILIESDSSLYLENQFTFEAWVKIPATIDTADRVIIGKGKTNLSVAYQLSLTTAGKLHVYLDNDTSDLVGLESSSAILPDRWNHVAATYNGSDLRLFINGTESGSASVSEHILNSAEPLFIGKSLANSADDYFNGEIDEVRISSLARTPSEFNLQLRPLDLSASVTGTTIDLDWLNGGGASPLMEYIIYRGADTTAMTQINTAANLSYADSGLPISTTYYYRIGAVDSTGVESDLSFAVSALTADIVPPTDPTAVAVIDSMQSNFTLQWNSSVAEDFRAYLIYGGTNVETLALLDSTTAITDTTKFIDGLTIGTKYFFTVTAIDTNGIESGSSNYASAVPYMYYPVTPYIFGNGTINPDSMLYIDHGDSVTFTVNAGAFNHIDSVVIDAVYMLVEESSDESVRETRRVSAKRPLTKQPPGPQLLTSFPAFIGGEIDDTLFVYTFANVASAHTISAFFSANPNIAPYFTSVLPDTAVARFDTLTYAYFAVDPEGSEINYTLIDGPAGTYLDPLNGLLTYIPAPEANGTYQFVVQIADDSTVTIDTAFVRVNIYGDVSGNGTISAFDASHVLRHAVQIDTLTELQQRVGDVTGDMTISAFDASHILQYTVGLITSFPGGLGKIAQPEAILSAFSFRIDKSAEPDHYDLFVSVSKPSNVFGALMTLSFDSTVVSPLATAKTALTDSMMMAFHFPDQKAHMALAGMRPMNVAGDIIKFTFMLKDRNYPKNAVLFTMDRFILNETDHTNDVGGITLNVRGPAELPTVYALSQNFPNPFNPVTTINYQLPEASSVTITIYNTLGQEVKRLVNEQQIAGYYSVQWNGTNHDNRSVASGMYIYRIEAAGGDGAKFTQVKKMMLLK